MKENSPSRILVVGYTDNPGGVETLLLNILKTMDSSKVAFDFLVNSDEVAFERKLLSYGSRIFRITPRRKNRVKFYSELKSFYRLHSDEYEAVWENVNSLANIDYLIYAKRYGVPNRIIHCHNSSNSEGLVRGMLHRGNRARIRRYATHYWSVSDRASLWFYGENYDALPNYRVVTNTIDSQHFDFDDRLRREIRHSMGLPNGAFVMGNVGRLHPQKNQALAIDVLSSLIEQGQDGYLVLVGKGDLEGELRARARKLGIEERVIFTGAVEDTAPYYNAMDVFIFPSLYEGLSIARLESVANGLPSVVSTEVPLLSIDEGPLQILDLNDTAERWADAVNHVRERDVNRVNRIKGTIYDLQGYAELFEGFYD